MGIVFDCKRFSLQNMELGEGRSSGTFYFYDSHCLSDNFLFGSHIFLLLLGSVTSLVLLSPLLQPLFTQRSFPPLLSLLPPLLSLFSSLLNIVVSIGYFFDVRGFGRALVFGIPLAFTFSGIVLVLVNWFRVVLSYSPILQKKYEAYLSRIMIGVTLLTEIPSMSLVIASGAFEDGESNLLIWNVLWGMWFGYKGLVAILISIMIMISGNKIVSFVDSSLSVSFDPENSKLAKISSKVKTYTRMQAFVFGGAGTTAIGVAIWSVVSLVHGTGMPYSTVLMIFWHVPAQHFVNLLVLYASKASSFRSSHSSSNASEKLSHSNQNKSDHSPGEKKRSPSHPHSLNSGEGPVLQKIAHESFELPAASWGKMSRDS